MKLPRLFNPSEVYDDEGNLLGYSVSQMDLAPTWFQYLILLLLFGSVAALLTVSIFMK